MNILGIETSCDETSAAVVADGRQILSHVVLSQIDVHRRYGGVVPELASRNHLSEIDRVAAEALRKASATDPSAIDGVAVTHGPGLIGSLLVGVTFAKGYACARRLPLCGVNHIEAHLYAAFLSGRDDVPAYPYVGLVVSGGHTSLFKVDGIGRYALLGATRDDAAGEAFDKVAKLLELGYPGGPQIDRLARQGNPKAVAFPRGMSRRQTLDFSFSGLKTAVLYYKKGFGQYAVSGKELSVADLAASFQEAVVDALCKKTFRAAQHHRVRDIVVGGGVSLNSRLREKFSADAAATGIRVHFPQPALCGDNAAMIAGLGYFKLSKMRETDYNFDAEPYLKL
ncbi:MAG TPA: tRNA (adenosine(37)-N6)-threonylcarbamoyltransferase complex transferase subunit TsaD [bacterium]|nr:tRNA (adenosine(37)-N6)-threonylcarbamoyltransferase complex transferase subunit TsaD [bacterium]